MATTTKPTRSGITATAKPATPKAKPAGTRPTTRPAPMHEAMLANQSRLKIAVSQAIAFRKTAGLDRTGEYKLSWEDAMRKGYKAADAGEPFLIHPPLTFGVIEREGLGHITNKLHDLILADTGYYYTQLKSGKTKPEKTAEIRWLICLGFDNGQVAEYADVDKARINRVRADLRKRHLFY